MKTNQEFCIRASAVLLGAEALNSRRYLAQSIEQAFSLGITLQIGIVIPMPTSQATPTSPAEKYLLIMQLGQRNWFIKNILMYHRSYFHGKLIAI